MHEKWVQGLYSSPVEQTGFVGVSPSHHLFWINKHCGEPKGFTQSCVKPFGSPQ